MLKQLRKTLANFISPVQNSPDIGNDFLINGSRRMSGDWSNVVIDDRDLYSGYFYSVIRNRSAAVARIGEDVRTETKNDKNEFIHPYLELIRNAPNFSEFAFWQYISTYLDLE